MRSFLGFPVLLIVSRYNPYGRGIRPQERVHFPVPVPSQRYASKETVNIRGSLGDDSCMSSIQRYEVVPTSNHELDLSARPEMISYLKASLIPQVVQYFENSMKVRRVSTLMQVDPFCVSYTTSSDGSRTCTEFSASCTTINNQSIEVPSDFVVGS